MSEYSLQSVESFYDSEITIALPEEEAINPCKYKIKKCRGLLKHIQEVMGNEVLGKVKKEQMINEIENYKKKYGSDNFSEAYHQLIENRKNMKKANKNIKKNSKEKKDSLDNDDSPDKLINKKRNMSPNNNRDSSSSIVSIDEKVSKKKNNNQNLSDYSSYSGDYDSISYENIISSNESYSISESYEESNKDKIDNTNNKEFTDSNISCKGKEPNDTMLNADGSTINDRPLWRENYLKFKRNFEKNFTSLYGQNSKLSYHIYKAHDGFVYHFRSASMYVKNPNIIRLVCGKNHCAGSGVYDIISHKLKTQHEHSQSKEEHMKYETLKKLNQDFEDEIKGLNPGEGFQIFIIKQQKKEKFLIIKDAI